MKRAILLARVSTPEQAKADRTSLDFQEAHMRAYCADFNLNPLKVIREDQSGRTMHRDGLEEALDMLERDEADVLVTYKIARLSRNFVDSVVLRDKLRRMGKELHYSELRTKSGSTAKERLPEDVLAILAEIEADEIAERADMGRKGKVAKQKWLGIGRSPYGYKRVGHGRSSTMIIDEWAALEDPQPRDVLLSRIEAGEVVPDVLAALREGKATAVVIRCAFVWYVHGDGESGPMSIKKIVQKLTDLGIPTPTDMLPHYSAVHKKQGYAVWHRMTVQRFLRNRGYAGSYEHFKHQTIDGRTYMRPKEEWKAIPIPALISEDLWAAVQRKMDIGRAMSPRGATYEYLVARRIQCECGYLLRASTSASGTRRKTDGGRSRFSYYRCRGRRGDQNVRPCDMPTLASKKIDARIWEWVKTDLGDPVVLERKLREIQEQQQEATGGQQEALRALTEHSVQIEGEMERIGRQYGRGVTPEHILDKLMLEQRTLLEKLEQEITKKQREIETPLSDETIASLVAFSEDFGSRLGTLEKTFEGRRRVIEGLDVRVQVLRRTGQIFLKARSLLCPDGMVLLVDSIS